MNLRERRIMRYGLLVVALLGVVAWAFVRSNYGEAEGRSSIPDSDEESVDGFTVSDAPAEISGSIPRPNSGAAPEDPGDRGGYLQLGLLAVILGGVGFIGYRVVNEGRRNLERQKAPPVG